MFSTRRSIANSIVFRVCIVTRQELKLKNTNLEKLERSLKEHIARLAVSEDQNTTQKKKFAEIESQAQDATTQMKRLQVSLAECQDEIKVYMQQLDEMKKEHDDEIHNSHEEVCTKSKALTITYSFYKNY